MAKNKVSAAGVQVSWGVAYLHGLLWMFIFFGAALAALASLVFFTDFTLRAAMESAVFTGMMLLGVLFASFCAARRAGAGGWLLGVLLGGTYALVTCQLGAALLPEAGGWLPGGKFFACAFAGALGGVIGVNV